MATTDLGKVKGSSVYSFPIDSLGVLYTYDESQTQQTGYGYCFKVPSELVSKLIEGDSIIAYLPESARAALAALDMAYLNLFYGGMSVPTDPPLRSTVVPYYFDNPLEQIKQWDPVNPVESKVLYGEISEGDYILYYIYTDISGEHFTFAPSLGGDPGKSFVLLDITGQLIIAPASSSTMSINVVNKSFYDDVLSITTEDTYAMLVSDDMDINGTIIPLYSTVSASTEEPEAEFTSGKLRYNAAFYNALKAGEFPTIKPVPFISDSDFDAARDTTEADPTYPIDSSAPTIKQLFGMTLSDEDFKTFVGSDNAKYSAGEYQIERASGFNYSDTIDTSDLVFTVDTDGNVFISGSMTATGTLYGTRGNSSYLGTLPVPVQPGTVYSTSMRRKGNVGSSTDLTLQIGYGASDRQSVWLFRTSGSNMSLSSPNTITPTVATSTASYTSGVASEIGATAPPHTFVTAEQFKSNAVTHWEKYDILDTAFTTVISDANLSTNSSFLRTDGHTVQLFIDVRISYADTSNFFGNAFLALATIGGVSTFQVAEGSSQQYKDMIMSVLDQEIELYTVTGYVEKIDEYTDEAEEIYTPRAYVSLAYSVGTPVLSLVVDALDNFSNGFQGDWFHFKLSASYLIG